MKSKLSQLTIAPRHQAAAALGAASAAGRTPPLAVSGVHHASAGPAGFGQEPILVHQPGGQVVNQMVSPQFTPIEQLYRKLPEEGWFQPSVSAQRPVQFELGSFQVPDGLELWLMDYEFSVFRPSGVDAGDVVQAARWRFSGFMGFDMVFDGRRLSHLLYELDPSPVTVTRTAFSTFAQKSQEDFNRAAFNSFAANSPAGTSLLPVRSDVQGARNVPFCFIVQEDSRVSFSAVIFRPLTAPVAFVQARFGGFLVQNTTSRSLVNRMRPK